MITTETTTELSEFATEAASVFQSDAITLYKLHQAVNATLVKFDVHKNGLPYRVRPQMMYNYSDGMIVPKQKVERVTVQQAVDFIVRFVTRQMNNNK